MTWLDTRVVVERLLPPRTGATPARATVAAIVAELAGWDLALAEHLAGEPLISLLDPAVLLVEWAAARGWSADDAATQEECWAQGRLDELDGATQQHAALLALANPHGLAMRLWRAQVKVLWPWLEEQRQRMIFDLQPHLPRIPLADKELSQLRHPLNQVSDHRVIARWRAALDALVDVRNALAHLEVASYWVLERAWSETSRAYAGSERKAWDREWI